VRVTPPCDRAVTEQLAFVAHLVQYCGERNVAAGTQLSSDLRGARALPARTASTRLAHRS
jgi:hypothetical protein